MRPAHLLALGTVVLSISCHAFGATRGVGLLLAVVVGILAWAAQRGHARAGGSTGGSTGSGGADTETTAGTESSSGAPADTTAATGSGTAADDTGMEPETGACLSAPHPTDTDGDPELAVCLCACDTGHDDPSDWAPALLLPLMIRRRSRRESLERIAHDGRLPPDVVDRLRRRLRDDQIPKNG